MFGWENRFLCQIPRFQPQYNVHEYRHRGQHTALCHPRWQHTHHPRTDRVCLPCDGRSRIRTLDSWFAVRCVTIEPPLLLFYHKIPPWSSVSFPKVALNTILIHRDFRIEIPWEGKIEEPKLPLYLYMQISLPALMFTCMRVYMNNKNLITCIRIYVHAYYVHVVFSWRTWVLYVP